LVFPRFRKVGFLDSGGLDDDPGGRSWHGRGIRLSSVGTRSIWLRRASRLEVARLLEVSDKSVYVWRRQEQIDLGRHNGRGGVESSDHVLTSAHASIAAVSDECARAGRFAYGGQWVSAAAHCLRGARRELAK
jgi:hypothetical protein